MAFSTADRCTIVRYLMLGWSEAKIAEECRVHLSTVYRIRSNLVTYGSVRKPYYRQLGRARKLSKADEDALFEWLLSEA